jgi:simple sugar transport system ATP-binding protein
VTVGEVAGAGAEPRRPGAPLLQLADITVRFGTVTALAEAGMTVRAGTVHALLGENGAGKSTLMRVAFGMLRPQAGTITWRGAPVALPSPAAALALGVGMVHQHFSLVPEMTVAENVALGGRGRFDPTASAARVREVAARAGLTLDPTARVRDLPVGAQQRCEIVKALARDVSLLILDEPTAVLAPSEAAELLAWVRGFADRGGAVVLITHKLRDALAVANDVTVLRRGVVQLQAARDEVTEDTVAAAMLGRAREGGEGTGALGVRRQKARDEDRDEDRNEDRGDAAALTLDAVTYTDAAGVQRVAHASLQLRGGEIVGVAAVEGSGQHELLRLMAGRLAPTTGQLRRPAATGFIPEDRHRDAVLLDAPLTENVALRGAATRRGLMRWDQVATDTAALMARHDVRAPGPDVPMRTLSGGNQQKLVLARELDGHPALLVAENPTRGLDFVATAAVHDALRAARANGVAVVLYSSDLDEVLALADRVVVMLGGRLQALDTTDRDLVGRAMLGSR